MTRAEPATDEADDYDHLPSQAEGARVPRLSDCSPNQSACLLGAMPFSEARWTAWIKL
jgi:hypothetical protein